MPLPITSCRRCCFRALRVSVIIILKVC